MKSPSRSVCDVISAIRPKDTFDGSVQGKYQYEDDINKGLVEGGVEGRTGVQKSEVALKFERNNNEGACDMLC